MIPPALATRRNPPQTLVVKSDASDVLNFFKDLQLREHDLEGEFDPEKFQQAASQEQIEICDRMARIFWDARRLLDALEWKQAALMIKSQSLSL